MIGPGVPDDGFHEAVAIVADLDAGIDRLTGVFGFTTIWRGVASRGALDLLGVPAEFEGLEAVIGDPAQGRGHIRLFAFPGRDTGVMRDGAQAWDHGGIFDVNVRALVPIEPLHRMLTRAGFAAMGPITRWTFDGLDVKEVLDRDADGLAFALIERIAPPLPGFEHVAGPVSSVFNSTQTVKSFDAARAFYVDALGWQVVQESRWTHADGRNCLGLPLDTARTRELRVGIYQANGGPRGSVEVLEYAGEGLDFTSAAPPDRGWAALRFPLSDIDGFLSAAGGAGCTVLPRRRIEMEPYGPVDAGATITPWGVRLEAYRLL